ncbi:MAG: ABC transporter ATP-binding protein [Planctomycetota bacterium]|jgi:putative ABC transport system ATP-binding protein
MHALHLQNLTKTYPGAGGGEPVRVVDVPEFIVHDHQSVALIGASGSGKTTLLNLIAGILKPDTGVIALGGQDLAQLSEAQRDHARARSVGYVFQTFNLLPAFTALQNVELPMRLAGRPDRKHAIELLESVGLTDRLHHRPDQLSHGQLQRVALARALANHPALVLADEPTGALDHHNAELAVKLIRETCQRNDAALLMVTHDQRLLDGFDRVAPIHQINKAAEAVV